MGIDFSRSIFDVSSQRTWPPLLTIAQAAKVLNVSPWTLRQWDKQNKLVPLRMGSRHDRRYQKEQIIKVLNEGLS